VPWTETSLDALPVRDGFRLRGVDMTRLETFCDAAFAFAVTLLVIAGDGIPRSYDDLVLALKGVPAFAASFAAIASFWWSHRTWSRRFGLEDGVTAFISLAMVFVMLVYVYPLKMVFGAFASWASGGWLPSEFVLKSPRDLLGLFAVYGVGFAAQTGMLVLLHLRGLKLADELRLNEVERLRTRQEVVMHLALGATGVASALWALLLPPSVGVFAGFLYMTLPVTMPVLAIRYQRRVETLESAS
jgi:hypothetical protein